jgi:CubicO group peptidase (beta-lactamase class C family)
MKGTIMKKEGRKEFLKHKAVFLLFLIPFWLTVSSNMFLTAGDQPGSPDESTEVPKSEINEIEEYIRDQMKRGKIPGLSVVIIKGEKTIYKKCFVFANIKNKQQVNDKTLFEIGANSKAFTALGILLLKKEEKLTMNDPVYKHIPWFKMNYKGQEVQITIEQLLHHTSGIPFETFANIPISKDDNALEKTVKTLINKKLRHMPGEEFCYASINYDVLGLIIQYVSRQSFEVFMKKNILEPLGLNDTYLSRKKEMAHDMATGYKIGFLAPREYEAPVYRGNTPAGYFITNAEDMEKWLKIQLGIDEKPNFKEIIKESHQPNENITGFRYAKGWFIFQKKDIFHTGNDPNFSSFIVFSIPKKNSPKKGVPTQEKIGVAVLANINSSLVEGIGWGILAILHKRDIHKVYKDFCDSWSANKKAGFFTRIGKAILTLFKDDMPIQSADFYIQVDLLSSILICISAILFVVFLWCIAVRVKKINKKIISIKITKKASLVFGAITIVFIIYLYILYNLPAYMSYKLPWGVIAVWAPKTFVIFAIIAALSGFSCYVYLFFRTFFPKPKRDVKHLEVNE